MGIDIKTSNCIQDAARQEFNRFLVEAWQYLRPDGGNREMLVAINVKDPDVPGGFETRIEMTERGEGYEKVVLMATIRGW